MADYLPLCAFRQGLLPLDCRSCAWWQTTGDGRLAPEEAGAKRRQWMASLEKTWGSTGLLLQGTALPAGDAAADTGHWGGVPDPPIAAAISFAPPAALPRLQDMAFGTLPRESAFLFCLKVEEGYTRLLPRRLLHKALGQLRGRGVDEVFAVAAVRLTDPDGPGVADECRFFSIAFLAANGFEEVTGGGDLILMRSDLRGLLSLVEQVGGALRRVLRDPLAPSPAAWSRRSD